jgi:hypothetical protein
MAVELTLPGGKVVRENLAPDTLRRIELGEGERATAVLTPIKGFDVGAGPGVPKKAELRGGVCGLVFDGRGRRPLPVPEEAGARVAASERWHRELDLYPA